MFTMLGQVCAAISRLFSAVEYAAKSLENVAKVGDIMSQGFLDEEIAKNEAKMLALRKQIKAGKVTP